MTSRVEECRLGIGLGQAQMLKAIGARPYQKRVLVGQTAPSPAFVTAAERLYEQYAAWRETILMQVGKTITSTELANLFSVSYTRLYMWVRHGVLEPAKKTPDGYVFNHKSVARLFKINETALTSHLGLRQQQRRGPLAATFLQYVSPPKTKAA